MNKLTRAASSVALAALFALPGAAFAHDGESRFDRRQDHQLDRIEKGRQTGDITWREGIRLRRDQRRISAIKRDFERDGYLSRRERRILREEQNEAAANISDSKHNRRYRPWWLPRVGR